MNTVPTCLKVNDFLFEEHYCTSIQEFGYAETIEENSHPLAGAIIAIGECGGLSGFVRAKFFSISDESVTEGCIFQTQSGTGGHFLVMVTVPDTNGLRCQSVLYFR